LQNGRTADVLVAPFQFRSSPMPANMSVPRLGEMTGEVTP
jgi:hypothetical protein